MIKQNKLLLGLLITLMAVFFITGMIIGNFSEAFSALWSLQMSPARLINDFMESASPGAALINSALMGILGLVLILSNDVQLSGPTFAALLTMMGFGLFGKTPFNTIPIIAGVYFSARLVGKQFKQYIIIALFGTALGPLVSAVAFEMGLPLPAALIVSIGAGIFTGFLLPSIAVAMLHLHQGYNLYNMGLTCGFFGLFASAFIKATGNGLKTEVIWYSPDGLLIPLIIPVISLVFLIAAFISKRKQAFKDFYSILRHSGRLPSDFMDMESIEGALVNSALIGLIGSLYIYLIGADFNGPVIGGLMTIMGFAAFGTHVKNGWPVVMGVIASTLLFGKSLSAPGPVLAFIFSTTLAPLAGQFGVAIGFLGGFIHLLLVSQTGSWHGGMNLYNNGLAGGLTAAMIIAVIEWYRANKIQ